MWDYLNIYATEPSSSPPAAYSGTGGLNKSETINSVCILPLFQPASPEEHHGQWYQKPLKGPEESTGMPSSVILSEKIIRVTKAISIPKLGSRYAISS